jgi:hypothetical protein
MGAHFDPATGTEKVEPTIAIAANIAVRVIFLMLIFFISLLLHLPPPAIHY